MTAEKSLTHVNTLEDLVEAIILVGAGAVVTTEGTNGNGGAYANSDDLQAMLDAGEFSDYEPAEFEEAAARQHFVEAGVEFDSDTEWLKFEREESEEGYLTGSRQGIYVWLD